MSCQYQTDVDATWHRRRCDVASTSCACWVNIQVCFKNNDIVKYVCTPQSFMGQTIDLCTMQCRGGVGEGGGGHKRFTIGITSPPLQQNGHTPKKLMQTKFGL